KARAGELPQLRVSASRGNAEGLHGLAAPRHAAETGIRISRGDCKSAGRVRGALPIRSLQRILRAEVICGAEAACSRRKRDHLFRDYRNEEALHPGVVQAFWSRCPWRDPRGSARKGVLRRTGNGPPCPSRWAASP